MNSLFGTYRSHNNASYLIHFGILGQKWGVRRYQNEDGTLTEEGKRRYIVYDTDKNGKQKARAITSDAEKEFFKNHSSQLTKEGQHVVDDKNVDSDLKTLVKSVQFNRKYGENWLHSYNKAADIFNQKIGDINKKYSNPSVDEKTYRKYIKEVNDMWQSAYRDVLLKDFGEHPMDGRKWLNEAFAFSMYSNADDHIDDDLRRRWAGNK